jgi:predicted ATPase
LNYITSVINRALTELFPNDTRRIYLEKTLYHNQHPHVNVVLETSDGKQRDLATQSGNGLRQVISFLFVLSLIEIRKGRRLLIMDEVLNGLHPEAKKIIKRIMEIFSEEGFQFIMVEYGMDDIGRLYLVEKPDTKATVTPLDGVYNNEVFMFNRPTEENTEEAVMV